MGLDTADAVHRKYARAGQIAVALPFLNVSVGYALGILGPVPGANYIPLGIFALFISMLVYLRVRCGRGWFFRFYPRWVSKWPHLHIAFLCLGAPFSGSS